MDKHSWKNLGACQDYDTEFFFDKYEEDVALRPAIEKVCGGCPVQRQCFAVGISQKEWGIWGGVYLESGKVSREFNKHRSKQDWAEAWQNLTTDS